MRRISLLSPARSCKPGCATSSNYHLLRFVPTKAEDGRYLVCLTSHETLGRKQEEARIKLDVSYKPEVVIHRDNDKSMMKEGGRAVLKCFARAKPLASLKRFWQSPENRVKQIDQEVQTSF